MSRVFLASSLLAVALPCAAQDEVPMTVTLTAVDATTLEIQACGGPAVYSMAMLCAGPGGEGGCVNLPGGRTRAPQVCITYAMDVPNSTALVGYEFTLHVAQIEPPVYSVATNTVVAGG